MNDPRPIRCQEYISTVTNPVPAIILLLGLGCLAVGCGGANDKQAEGKTQQLHNAGDAGLAGGADDSNEVGKTLANLSDPEVPSPIGIPGSPVQTPTSQSKKPFTPATSVVPEPRPLKRDLNPAQLNQFLAEVDDQLRLIASGQAGLANAEDAMAEMERMVKLKREASLRLIEHADATEKERAIGQRGQLQSLSHLAAMGNLDAAKELETLAETYKDDPNPDLSADSQLVLIGFAIENLRHGKENADNIVVDKIEAFLESDARTDVAALMVMGQAKDALAEYESIEQANHVASLILDRFGRSADTEIARMAAQISAAGTGVSPELQKVETLRQRFVGDAGDHPSEAEDVTQNEWASAIDALAANQPDLLTVQFLAGASLEAEVFQREDLASTTYSLLEAQFADREDAVGREARTALQARKNRQSVIGQRFEPDLPSLDGSPLSISDYRGKIVLMPFWTSAFPDSLAILPNLREVREKHADQVEIVGINLDLAGTDPESFSKSHGLDFPSFRCESVPGSTIANEVAYQFGAVTLMFVAVLDQEGRVAAIEFSGRDLSPVVEKLIP